jgi:hypothetical protein
VTERDRGEPHNQTQVITVDDVDVVISAVISDDSRATCYGVYSDEPRQHRRLPTEQLGVVYQHAQWWAEHDGLETGPYDTIVDAVAALIAARDTHRIQP